MAGKWPSSGATREEVRRRQLIQATIDSLADMGFPACTLGDIARRAGVSPGLVAHYFGDKEGLLEATLRAMAARLGRSAAARLAAARTPRGRVQAIVDANLAPEEFDRRTCERLARLLGPGAAFGPLQARPERLPAAHALEPAARPEAGDAARGRGADRAFDLGDDRRALAQGDPLRGRRTRQQGAPAPWRAPSRMRNSSGRGPSTQPPRKCRAPRRRRRGCSTKSAAAPSAPPPAGPSPASTRPPARPSPRSRSPARRRSTTPSRRRRPARPSGAR